mgnify:CR=1 FL=1
MSNGYAVHDLVVRNNETFRQRITWLDTHKLPVDVTGYRADMYIRQTNQGVILQTWGNPEITVGAEPGVIDIKVPVSKVNRLLAGNAYYDLRLTSPGGDVTVIATGRLTIVSGVTMDRTIDNYRAVGPTGAYL